MMDPKGEAVEITRKEFDELARGKFFGEGPFVDTFGDGPGDPYAPEKNRNVWGRLKTGTVLWARGKDEQHT